MEHCGPGLPLPTPMEEAGCGSQLPPIDETKRFSADPAYRPLDYRPSENAGDLGADAAHQEPQPTLSEGAVVLDSDMAHQQPRPAPRPGAKAGELCADAAHQQLLEALRAIDRKLDGLAGEISSCMAKPASPRTRESQRTAARHSLGTLEHRSRSSQVRTSVQTLGGEHRGQEVKPVPSMASNVCHVRSRPNQEVKASRRSTTSHVHHAPSGQVQAELLEHVKSCQSELLDIKIRPGYGTVVHANSHMSKCRTKTTFIMRRSRLFQSSEHKSRGWRAWSPDSRSRVMFEVLSMALLLYDAFLTPYRMAWVMVDDDSTGMTEVVWFTRLFWMLDLLLNPVTGYHDEEANVEQRIPVTARRYLATWFLIDLACVVCDWLTVFYYGEGWTQWMRLARLVRGARHIPQFRNLSFGAKLMIQANGVRLAMDIAQLVLAILWVNHLICCIWFGIGQFDGSDTGATWLSGRRSARAGPYYDYLTSLHWAITQMTPGSMEVMPRNSLERLYNLFVLVLGLMMGSSLVATITSRMTQYLLRIDASTRKLSMLRHFLRQQGVDTQRSMAIMVQVRNRTSEKQRIKAKDVEYLSLLPNSLQAALWHAWCTRNISAHTFLTALNRYDPAAMQALCKGAIVGEDVTAGDVIFEEGLTGDTMFFVLTGRLRYTPGDLAPEVQLLEEDPRLLVGAGDWCCEPALWTIWTCLGTMEAISTTEVLSISATELPSTLARYPDAAEVVADYCRAYHTHINEPGVMKSDLSHVFDLSEVLSWVDPDTRIQLAIPVIHGLESRFWVDHTRIQKLKKEIEDGKCDVGVVGNEVVRNAFVIALKIYKQELWKEDAAMFLVKMGQVGRHDDEVVGSCLLPGVKRKARERYNKAVERLLKSNLGEISQHIETRLSEGSIQTVSLQVSQTYGIRTRYLRTCFDATLTESASPTYINVHVARRTLTHMHGRTSWWVRPGSSWAAADDEHAAVILAGQERAMVIQGSKDKGSRMDVYLWLTDSEFEVLSKDSAKPIIEEWLKALDPFKESSPETEADDPEIVRF